MKPVYKIRNKKTGKFKCAGWEEKWSKTGKVWGSMAALKGHLRRVGHNPETGNWGRYFLNDPDWEILEFNYDGKEKAIQL